MNLTPSISLVPLLHGRVLFAAHVRKLCLARRYDCIAVDLPAVFQDDLGPAVDTLPFIQAITAQDVFDHSCFYLPLDPCDAAIEGVRQARQSRIPFFCIGPGTITTPAPLTPLPDEHALKKIGFERYTALCLQAIGNPDAGSPDDNDAALIAASLHELAGGSRPFSAVLALVHMRHYTRVVYHFGRHTPVNRDDNARSYQVRTWYVNPGHLYFALGELPFVTGKAERERQDPLAPPLDPVTEVKNLFRETRDDYAEDPGTTLELSPVRIQTALTFLRNLTLMSGRLLPSLFDIVEAAKGVGGNAYALRILENARYYPYLPFELSVPLLGVGLSHITFPDSGEPVSAVNLLRDAALEWRTVSIRPDPSRLRKKKYRYAWDPRGMCSHLPEDATIERFNAHVRAKSLKVLVEELARTERFTSSVKDGIDIRETLRNWHTGGIFVKENPPARGTMDTVVIIFDENNDDRYPNRATWYAEHTGESTLTFYATDPFADLIGPGVARCRYGGLSLLFPPRHITDTFLLTEHMDLPSLASRLVYGALLHTGEKNVAYAAAKKPGIALRTLAGRMNKHLVWIPLSSFSNETIRRLRKFHILNGHEVRTWAGRFIGEE